MGHNLFKRRADEDFGASEFAATVVSVPSLELELDIERAYRSAAPPDSAVPDVLTDFGLDSGIDPGAEEAEQAAQPTLHSIGRYALKQQLGQGGLGTVFEAWDPLLSRMVAVKTLQFDIDTPTRVSLDALFLNEARAAAGLNHSYIVTVHDAGLSARGVYIAMERLQGRDLRHALQGAWQPSPAEAALLVRRVADALAYAHARGVVHCDIKPANIFLTRRGKPKVLDFGIARVAHHAALPALDGVIAGSPHYQAPEQLQGGSIDARTDLYSLGTVLYELLTARKAFDGDSLELIRDAVAQHQPTPPHELCPAVPLGLSAIAMRAMARHPDERYANAAEMAQTLRHWLAAQTTVSGSTEPSLPADSGTQAAPVLPTAPAKPRRARWLGFGLAAAALALAAWLVLGPDPAAAPSVAQRVAPPANPPAPPTHSGAAVAALAPADAPARAEPPAAAASPTTEPVAAAAPVAPVAALAKPRKASPSKAVAAAPVSAEAAPLPKGTVHIAISPWGQVEVDGTPAGTTPPLTRLDLPPGTHTITVRNEDFPPHSVRVVVDPERPVTVKHRFGS